MGIITHYPSSLATTRLKINLFALLLTLLITHLFTPYLTVRRGLIHLFGQKYVGRAIWWIQALLLSVEVWNIVEAGLSIYYPRNVQLISASSQTGIKMTPIRMSSPLTRAYPTTSQAPQSPSPLQKPITPYTIQPATTTSLNRVSTPTTQIIPTNTPTRSAPLSASTAQILNLPKTGNPSSTGLFNESPSKPQAPAQTQGATQNQGTGTGTGTGSVGGDFVIVDKNDRDYVDNLRKGLIGKGGRLGL